MTIKNLKGPHGLLLLLLSPLAQAGAAPDLSPAVETELEKKVLFTSQWLAMAKEVERRCDMLAEIGYQDVIGSQLMTDCNTAKKTVKNQIRKCGILERPGSCVGLADAQAFATGDGNIQRWIDRNIPVVMTVTLDVNINNRRNGGTRALTITQEKQRKMRLREQKFKMFIDHGEQIESQRQEEHYSKKKKW